MAFPKIAYSFVIVSISILVITYANGLLITKDIVFDYLIENNYSAEKIEKSYMFMLSTRWIQYVLLFLLITLKILFATLCLMIAIYFAEKKTKTTYILRVVILAQLIWLIRPLFQYFWFSFIQTKFTIEDFENFYTFSLNDFVEKQSSLSSFSSLFSLISVFELAYCLFIGYGLSTILKEDFKTYFLIVIRGYGLGSILIALMRTFIDIAYS